MLVPYSNSASLYSPEQIFKNYYIIYILTVKSYYHWSFFGIRICAQDQDMRSFSTIVTVSIVTSIAGTTEATNRVCTNSIRVAVVRLVIAFVDICATDLTIASVAVITRTGVATVIVNASRVLSAFVSSITAFVDVGAKGAVAVVSSLAFTDEATGLIDAGGIGIAVVASGDAFDNICATDSAIASVAVITWTGIATIIVNASIVLFAFVCSINAFVDVFTVKSIANVSNSALTLKASICVFANCLCVAQVEIAFVDVVAYVAQASISSFATAFVLIHRHHRAF